MTPPVTIVEADLERGDHQRDVVAMTQAYALDAMGNGRPLPKEVVERLVPALREHPTTIILLAFSEGRAVGIATCFLGLSTFTARPIINIHDLAVIPECRGRGIARLLLEAVERNARNRGCSKVTLEVQDGNAKAKRVYEAAGFSGAMYGQTTGGALFYTKVL
jgi:GNAT superfamily N-acetyltransferase